jgi:hypothetical protein
MRANMNTSVEPVTEQIVGYDSREWWSDFRESWTEEDQQKFLFRLDVRKPLSVDAYIWRNIFESEARPHPRSHIGFSTTWADLFDCLDAVTREASVKPLRSWKLVGITLLRGPYCALDNVPWPSRLPPVNPAERGPNWSLLGYDVADQMLLSGLTDCGFLPDREDVRSLRRQWGPRLNQWHLFDSIDDAIAFKHFSDRRMAGDHAPFFVFGLWIIKRRADEVI